MDKSWIFKDRRSKDMKMGLNNFSTLLLSMKEILIQLQREDIEYICEMKELTATCILLYMSHLFCFWEASNKKSNFLYVNPGTISGATKIVGGSKAAVLATRLADVTTEKLILLPYNIGKHWILVVMDLSSSIVYYLDSLENTEVNPSLEIVITTALKIYETTKGSKGNRRRNATWKVVKCPKQPPSVECGFYVMRYVKDLLRNEDILSKENFNGKKTYTVAEIDEVRAEWISFVHQKSDLQFKSIPCCNCI